MVTLVVGYGNSLRGDDGVGVQVAERVAAWKMVGVEAIALHQLTPELVLPLADADRALFIDASWKVSPGEVNIAALRSSENPSPQLPFSAHASRPTWLLDLTHRLYERCPEAWWIQLGIEQVNLGDRLSKPVEHAMEQVLHRLYLLLSAPNSSVPLNIVEALCTSCA